MEKAHPLPVDAPKGAGLDLFVRAKAVSVLLLPILLTAAIATTFWAERISRSHLIGCAIAAIAVAGSYVLQCQNRRQWNALFQKLHSLLGDMPPDLLSRPVAVRLSWQIDQVAHLLSSVDRRFAQIHALSGLPTREPLMEAMRQAPEGGVLGLVDLCDFDRLTLFDVAVADRVLVEIAQRLTRMVGSNRFLAHVDRSRFAIWYPEAEATSARTELDAIGYSLRDRILLPGIDMLPQVRLAQVEPEGRDCKPADILARGLACLSSSDSGANSNNEAVSASARNLFLLEQDLRQAAARNEFELWFQPFVDSAAQKICGAEALLRWRHPTHGLVAPTTFIPVMEAAGLAEEIGLWTLNAGCREARNWERSDRRKLKVAVNLSAHQLERGDLDMLVDRTLRRHGLPASLLELELTETVASVDSAAARSLFDKLRTLGVAISIDDFGAGYSSLSYLKKLHFDKIKIDREFVNHVDRQRDSQAICQSILALGRGLGIQVLAEGVERPEEYAWLRRHGCTLFQGYYFSRPVEADAFLSLVRNDARIRARTDLSPIALQERAMMSRR